MTDERWQEIVDKLTEQFSVIEHIGEPGSDGHSTIDRIVFRGPAGTLRLERTVHDRVVGEKAVGSKRIGGDVAIEKIYADGEQVDYLKLARLNESSGEWEELDPDKLAL